MGTSKARHRWPALAAAAVLAGGLLPLSGGTAASAAPAKTHLDCKTRSSLCTEVVDSETVFGEDVYVGHDEPAALFYDNRAGAGNNNTYLLRLPKDPPTLPTTDGKGGTFNFQLHPAFWFGMAMCDDESSPEFTHTACTPDSDSNIFDSSDPNSPQYVGKHPGTAFMEMQFYPPGWVPFAKGGTSCDATKWCAALNVDSLAIDLNTNTNNNADCQARAGDEPVNFAFITRNGKSHAPADPLLSTSDTFTPNPATDLFMNAGDQLVVALHDTAAGFRVDIVDLTSHTTGSMTASVANQFGQVVFDPTATTCSSRPYAFHPMYSTSSEHTRVPWAAHGYNVAFSDEIGHFENCAAVAREGGACTTAGTDDGGTPDADDVGCFSGATGLRAHNAGCLASDVDFDGASYQKVWPGSSTPGEDARLHPRSVLFSSPTFNGFQRYHRVAFEADLPRIEATCNRTTGAGCVNPPAGAQFYPLFTTRDSLFGCQWQLGGANIPGTRRTFGGTSATEFGPLLPLVYPAPGGPITRLNDFRRTLDENPCT